jgi:uncharacterized protein YegL
MVGDSVGLDAEDPNLDMTVERTPAVLILDTSGSMTTESRTSAGERKSRIEQVNEGLELFKREVTSKENAADRVDVALVEFGGGVDAADDWTTIRDWTPPTLSAGGKTPMGEAIKRAIDLAEEVKEYYRSEGIAYTRPSLWLLTDGQPTDMDPGDSTWEKVRGDLEMGVADDHFLFFAMGVGDADVETLDALVEGTGKPALEIEEGTFEEYFRFVSNSLENVSSEDGEPDKVANETDLSEFVKT